MADFIPNGLDSTFVSTEWIMVSVMHCHQSRARWAAVYPVQLLTVREASHFVRGLMSRRYASVRIA